VLVTWDPEDGSEKQTWDFDPGDVKYSRIKQIEAHYGGTWDAWKIGLMAGEMKARGILLWYMMTQVHPKLSYRDLPDFRARQLTVDMGTRELLDLKKRVEKMRGLSDEQREQFDIQFEVDMREAMAKEGVDGEIQTVDGQLAIETTDGIENPLPKPV